MLSPMQWLFNKCPALKYCHFHVFPDAEIFFCNLHKSQILQSFSRKKRFFVAMRDKPGQSLDDDGAGAG